MPRALTAVEKAAGERIAERLRKSLPTAPPGWKVRDEDLSDVAAGSCLSSTTKKMVPQPVSVLVRRSFLRNDPAPDAGSAVPKPAATAAAHSAEAQARAQTLERQIAELRRKENEATKGYMAARGAGDSEAQQKFRQEARDYRAATQAPLKELAALRDGERRQRDAESKAQTAAAFARAQEQLANRRDASVHLYANSGQKQVRGAKPVPVAGVPLALRDGRGATHLLFGDWVHLGNYASNPFDEAAPTTRVQDVSVRLDGNDAVTQHFLKAFDLLSIQAIMEKK